MTNKEKFLTLVSKEKTDTVERNRERIKNRAMLRESQKIAIKVLMRLDELGWTQKYLADKMEVNPQQITKIVSGKENLTIETQIKLQNILDIPVLVNIWFTSDSHYGHSNIAGPKVSNWKSGYRNFNSVWEMNQALIDGINKYVKEDDILYHLGDWSFGGVHNILHFRNSLICKNIHLIKGNHDQHIVDKEIKFHDTTFNPIDLFSSVQDVLTLKVGNQTIFMSHYAHRVWLGSHKGFIHLFAHSHNNLPGFGKSMDVGMDVAYAKFGEYRPFNIGDITNIMEKRKIEFVDHHDEDTNI